MWLVLDIFKDNITEILNVGMDEYLYATEVECAAVVAV